MQAKFVTVFKWYVVVLVGLLLWSAWGSAQTPQTNATTTNATPKVGTAGLFGLDITAEEKQALLTFGLDQIEPLKLSFLGTPLWKYLASAIFILLAFYLSKLLDYLIQVRLKKWAAKTETKFDDLLLELLQGPVKVVSFVVLLHVGLRVFDWPDWISAFFSNGLKIVVACSLTYMALKFVDLLMGQWKDRVSAGADQALDVQLFPVIRKSVKAFIIIVAALVTSQNLGLNITGVLASLSIGGLALGLAAQDTLANLFGAVAVFVDKPFRIGDRIRIESTDGTVESIGLRSTRIRNLDGFLVTIPNKTMGNSTITNITRRPTIKTEMNIGITYDTPVEKVELAVKSLEQIYRAHAKTADLVVTFNRFADSALNLNVVHWWNGADNKEYLAGIQALNLEIKRRFDALGVEFAFPTQTLYHKQDLPSQASTSRSAGAI